MQEIIGIFGIDWRLLIMQGINFGVLLVLLWYILYRPLLRMIDKRRVKIEEGVRNAEKVKERLSIIESEKEHIINEAILKAELLVKEGKSRAEVREGELVQEAKQKGDRILKDALMRAEEKALKMEEESRAEIARLAILGAEKVLQK